MKLFSRGYEFQFESHPTLEKLKSWVLKKTGPLTTEITTDAQFKDLQNSHFAVGFFGPDDEIFEEYLKIAIIFPNIDFYHSHDERYLQLNNMNSLTIFKDFQGGNVNYHGILDMEKMEEFLKENR